MYLIRWLLILILWLMNHGFPVAVSAKTARLTENNLLRTAVFRQCDTPILKNGHVRLRQRGKLIRYVCGIGYQLSGERYAACQNGRWDSPLPICIKPGCQLIDTIPNGFVVPQNNGGSAILFCNPGYQTAGSRYIYCDGRQWDRAIGTCRQTNVGPSKWCDFETEMMCDWTADFTHDFEWRRRTGTLATTMRIQSGPRYDHTIMKPLEGHYMVAESALQMAGDRARLMSPPYPANFSIDACFQMYYHMYGSRMGTLRVYVKPVSILMENVISDVGNDNSSYLLFEKRGTQKNQWKEAVFVIPKLNEKFHIVIEAIAGQSQLSDIAIDDIAILTGNECLMESAQLTTKLPQPSSSSINQTEDMDGGVFDIQSCTNRCNDVQFTMNKTAIAPNGGFLTNETILNGTGKGGILLHCDCFDGCEDLKTCCIDYKSICVFSSTSDDLTDEYQTNTIATNDIEKQTIEFNPNIALTSSTSFVQLKINNRSTVQIVPKSLSTKVTIRLTPSTSTSTSTTTATQTIVVPINTGTIKTQIPQIKPSLSSSSSSTTIKSQKSTTTKIKIPTTTTAIKLKGITKSLFPKVTTTKKSPVKVVIIDEQPQISTTNPKEPITNLQYYNNKYTTKSKIIADEHDTVRSKYDFDVNIIMSDDHDVDSVEQTQQQKIITKTTINNPFRNTDSNTNDDWQLYKKQMVYIDKRKKNQIDLQQQKQQIIENSNSKSFTIPICLLSAIIVIIVIVILIVIYRQSSYANPLNYKNNLRIRKLSDFFTICFSGHIHGQSAATAASNANVSLSGSIKSKKLSQYNRDNHDEEEEDAGEFYYDDHDQYNEIRYLTANEKLNFNGKA